MKSIPLRAILRRGSRRCRSGVYFGVIDTGHGVPPGKRDSIFEEFGRLGASDKPSIGLGLRSANVGCGLGRSKTLDIRSVEDLVHVGTRTALSASNSRAR